jgi:hypothetical protein
LPETVLAFRKLGSAMRRCELRYILAMYARDLARRMYEQPAVYGMTFAMARQEYKEGPKQRRLFRGPLAFEKPKLKLVDASDLRVKALRAPIKRTRPRV